MRGRELRSHSCSSLHRSPGNHIGSPGLLGTAQAVLRIEAACEAAKPSPSAPGQPAPSSLMQSETALSACTHTLLVDQGETPSPNHRPAPGLSPHTPQCAAMATAEACRLQPARPQGEGQARLGAPRGAEVGRGSLAGQGEGGLPKVGQGGSRLSSSLWFPFPTPSPLQSHAAPGSAIANLAVLLFPT